MSAKLPKLIEDMNDMDSCNKITCIIVTKNMGWALELGHKLGIKGALFWPASATSLTSFDSIQRLINEGIIDSENGLPIISNEEIQIALNLPIMDISAMPWYCLDNNFFFQHMMQEIKTLNLGEWWLCNTTLDLEAGAFSISPKLLPIGPLIASDQNTSSFMQEDLTCLDWLDLQPPQSVIYVSFGSMVSTKPNQFNELALGLELLNKPFLWVVRNGKGNNVNNTYPDEFTGREGVYGGVPFLCWPFCSDQLMNKTYICDVWKVGLGFDKDENGLISRGEIEKKVEQVLGDREMKERSSKLMEMVIKSKSEGDNNLNKFISWAKE
ncbi:unnamed protein product [Lupinus luteus]|uniref:Uncharacterized protein n=1 Tax=Lupinus luteus TaxID=3873 RepID=A0AAV1WG70_LUPLU